ncbi:hypothetical protein ANN_14188 [Periplaneta americana]|uniref:Uncharacterized protein n=1 Tax=Periplaneta americana TaxID=6978 RepID=A0ABQ8SVL9_PERAM|nr:hypothetical protein ANN_14188 [Periplaneta americana]
MRAKEKRIRGKQGEQNDDMGDKGNTRRTMGRNEIPEEQGADKEEDVVVLSAISEADRTNEKTVNNFDVVCGKVEQEVSKKMENELEKNKGVLVGRPEGERPLGMPRRRWEDNIKMDLREVEYDDRDWINLTQDGDQWRAYVRAAMNLRVP